jgi:hypothetical protein
MVLAIHSSGMRERGMQQRCKSRMPLHHDSRAVELNLMASLAPGKKRPNAEPLLHNPSRDSCGFMRLAATAR